MERGGRKKAENRRRRNGAGILIQQTLEIESLLPRLGVKKGQTDFASESSLQVRKNGIFPSALRLKRGRK